MLLESLQIWTLESSYLPCSVYEDVKKALEQWNESGRKVYIYSSGSVDAQKMLFEHSEQGDLVKYLAGYYDTKIGAKQEKNSYEALLKNIEATGEEALFLTDVVAGKLCVAFANDGNGYHISISSFLVQIVPAVIGIKLILKGFKIIIFLFV